MPKARKVATPGSQASILSPRGRPKKAKSKHGTSRKDNYRTKYTEAMFLEAMECIKEKRMSVREAAKQYGVPKTTLLDRIANRRGAKLGQSTELSQEEEECIVERLLLLGKWGFPLSKKDLASVIKSYLERLGATTRNVLLM
jgi:transposase-like protein